MEACCGTARKRSSPRRNESDDLEGPADKPSNGVSYRLFVEFNVTSNEASQTGLARILLKARNIRQKLVRQPMDTLVKESCGPLQARHSGIYPDSIHRNAPVTQTETQVSEPELAKRRALKASSGAASPGEIDQCVD